MKLAKTSAKKKQGFTLIELSIVLVIIGLIVGGVLVGQDLIKAAETRATVAQVEKYNTAINTFRSKFNGLPGDLQATESSSFGLFGFTGSSAGTAGMGDGNGLLQSASSGNLTYGIGETLAFWRHLSDANLVDGAFGSSGSSLIVASTGATTGAVSNIAQSLPPAKLGRGNSFAIYANAGKNYYEINGITAITTAGAYTAASPQLTPQETYSIEVKVDDGQPNTGNVKAKGPAATGALNKDPTTTAGTGCATGTAATDTYIRTNTSPACAAQFGTQ